MDAAARDAVIRVRDLVVAFGRQVILDGISIDVYRGEILGVVGGSGSGKSVLLRAIVGLLPRRRGTVEVLGAFLDPGRDSGWRAIERRWGILFQQGALFSSLTVRQNVQFPMREYLHLSEAELSDAALAKLELVGIGPGDADKYPAELSGGMTKRVALARALALDPEILFLDEPTSGLDPITAAGIDRLVRALQNSLKISVFMVTHDLASLRTACDRVAALAEGRIVAAGPVEAMRDSTHPWVKAYFGGDRGHLGDFAPLPPKRE